MIRAGLPVISFKEIPIENREKAAEITREFLKSNLAAKLSSDIGVSDPNIQTIFRRGDSKQRIMNGLTRWGKTPAYLTGINPTNRSPHFGIITVEQNGRMIMDALHPATGGPKSAINNIHKLTRAQYVPSHSFVLEPGKFWRLVKNARPKSKTKLFRVETDIDEGLDMLRRLRANGHDTILLGLAKEFGAYSVTFSRTPEGKLEYVHPLSNAALVS